MGFCSNCGSQINDNASVCPYCGASTGYQNFNQGNNNYKNGYQTSGNVENVQALIHKAPLSASFIISAVIGGILAVIMTIGMIIILCSRYNNVGKLLSVITILIALFPATLFLIGQFVFIANGASKQAAMPTAGMTVMTVSLIIQTVYTVLGVIAYMIMDLVWINEFNKHVKAHKGSAYYRRNFHIDISRSEDITLVRIVLWVSFFAVIIIGLLDIIAYIRACTIFSRLKQMRLTNTIANKNLPVYPSVIFYLKTLLMFLLSFGFFMTAAQVHGGEISTGYYIGLAIGYLLIGLYYLFLSTSVISFNGKLSRFRFQSGSRNMNR